MNTIEKVRILLVDDHEVVREGLRFLLSNERPQWEIAGEATTGNDAIEKTQLLKPDIVILDITMPGMSGLEASSLMRKLGVRCPILIFTMHHSERLAEEVRQSGAQGFVVKSQAFRDLVRAIDTLLGGGTFFGMPIEKELNPKEPQSGLTYRLGLRFAPGLGIG